MAMAEVARGELAQPLGTRTFDWLRRPSCPVGGGGSRQPQTALEPGPRPEARSPPTEMRLQTAPAFPTGTSKGARSQRVPWSVFLSARSAVTASYYPSSSVRVAILFAATVARKLTRRPTCRAGPVGIHSQLGAGESGQLRAFPLQGCLFRM